MLYASFSPIQPITTTSPLPPQLGTAQYPSDEPTSNIAGLLSVTTFNVCPSIFIAFSSTFPNITWFGSRKARAQDGLVPA